MERLCCIDCFTYDSVKKYIKESGLGENYCDFCQKKSDYCIKPSELADMFHCLIDLYDDVNEFLPTSDLKRYEGETIVERLLQEWEPFTIDTFDAAEDLLTSIFGRPHIKYGGGIDTESWVENKDEYWGISEEFNTRLTEEWKDFCDELIYKNRFFPSTCPNLKMLCSSNILNTFYPKGQKFYRARVCKGPKKIEPKKMGAPPINRSKNGRANPKGIPYLYLASDLYTAIYEIHPNINSFITIGVFKAIDELSIFDLTSPRIEDPLVHGYDLPNIIQNLAFFRMLGDQLSIPIDQENKELQYISSQYLCEFIKNEGYDGIAYKSSIGKGHNVALFQNTKTKCTRSYLYKIGANPEKIDQC